MTLRIFNQHMDALGGGKVKFSGEFIRWLQSLLGWASIREWEADLGSVPVRSGSFTITDGQINEGHRIVITQAAGPYTGKASADEAEMDALTVTAKAAAGTAVARWSSATKVRGYFKFHYRIS